MEVMNQISLRIIIAALIFWPMRATSQAVESTAERVPVWYVSFQYLGLTYHPGGGNTPEVYPLKLDRKAYLVLDVGTAANLDYRLNDYSFIRFTSALYKDCAFVMAGGVHLGPRLQYSWGDNRINLGIGPILSFREDWHRFAQYQDDEFYGKRVYNGWQYRFFWYAVEFEYLRKINETMEFQWSVIPGGPLIITSLFGVRLSL
jgi:hypothetical protein